MPPRGGAVSRGSVPAVSVHSSSGCQAISAPHYTLHLWNSMEPELKINTREQLWAQNQGDYRVRRPCSSPASATEGLDQPLSCASGCSDKGVAHGQRDVQKSRQGTEAITHGYTLEPLRTKYFLSSLNVALVWMEAASLPLQRQSYVTEGGQYCE